jgi:hypothetical protein
MKLGILSAYKHADLFPMRRGPGLGHLNSSAGSLSTKVFQVK